MANFAVFFDNHFVFAYFEDFAELDKSIFDFTDHTARDNFAFFVDSGFELDFWALGQSFVDVLVETLGPSGDGAFRVEGMMEGMGVFGLIGLAFDFGVFFREGFSAFGEFALLELNLLLFFF